jgi:hypothetical protein
MRPVVRRILLDIAPSLLAYYGLRACGVSEYIALLTATIVAGLKVAYDAVRARRLDPFAGYLMLNFGLSLAVGVATSDARLLLAGDALVGGIGGLIFLGSCVIGTPLTQVVAARALPPRPDVSPEERAGVRRTHIQVSAMWGVGLLLGTAAHLAIIFSLPIDVAKGLITVLSLTSTAVLVALTVVIVKRAVARGRSASVDLE